MIFRMSHYSVDTDEDLGGRHDQRPHVPACRDASVPVDRHFPVSNITRNRIQDLP